MGGQQLLAHGWSRVLGLLLVAILPWRWSFALLRRLAWRQRHQPATLQALAAARANVAIADEEAFCHRHALYRLVDELDLALAWTRSRRWAARWLQREGAALPQQGAYLALTFHYGAGLPAWWALGEHQQGVAWIYTLPNPLPHGLALWLGRRRLAAVERLGGGCVIPTGGAWQQAACCLQAAQGVMALLDAPHFGHRRCSRVSVLGHQIGLARGLLELAQAEAVPVLLFSCRLAAQGPQRLLKVHGPLPAAPLDSQMQQVADFFSAELRADPAAWHFWQDQVFTIGFPPPAEGAAEDQDDVVVA